MLKKFPEIRGELYAQWRTTDRCAVSTKETAEVLQIANATIARIFLREHGKKFRGGPQETPIANDLDVPPPERVETSVYRILRDTELARALKAEMGYRCQICRETIELPGGGKYVEAHHIRPLGEPHAGGDVRGNLLCVCPNHHAMLDYGVISLDRAQLKHGAGEVSEEAIAYHNREIYGKVRVVKRKRKRE